MPPPLLRPDHVPITIHLAQPELDGLRSWIAWAIAEDGQSPDASEVEDADVVAYATGAVTLAIAEARHNFATTGTY